MKKLLLISCVFSAFSMLGNAQTFNLGESLTGDTRLSCEAILCLASPTKPSECSASIAKYFSFTAKKWHKVIEKRKNFLNLCPTDNSDNDKLLENAGIDPNQQREDTANFKDVLLNLPHDCSAGSLNKVIEKQPQNFEIYKAYVERYAEKNNLSEYEKLRMINSYKPKNDDNDYGLTITYVYRVSANIPSECERLYQHNWSQSVRPTHNKDYNWYYPSEGQPPLVWK